jgi:hypothetical protein
MKASPLSLAVMLVSVSNVSSGMVDVGLLVWTIAGLNGRSSPLAVPTPVTVMARKEYKLENAYRCRP